MRKPGVDIHCHVFNHTDLPSGPFFRDVVVGLDEWKAKLPADVFSVLLKMVVSLLKFPAPKGSKEIKKLRRKIGGPQALMQSALAGGPGAANELTEFLADLSEDTEDDFQARLESEMAALYAGGEAERALFDELAKAYHVEDPDVFAPSEIVDNEAGGTADESAEVALNELAIPIHLRRKRRMSREQFRSGTRSKWGSTMDFLRRLNDYRYQNCERLADMYGKAGGVNLFTPAMIDYNHWLSGDKNTKTPLEQQADVMELVCRYLKGSVHAYMAYDPLRDLRENGRSLKIVQDAVESRGFIGVKVYPPMGFQAWNNADLKFYDPDHPDRLMPEGEELGQKLDDRLEKLYRWCVEEEVPILAHTSSTVLSKEDYDDRPNPKHWEALIKTDGFESLQVVMGHFGGLGHLLSENEEPLEWPDTIVRMMGEQKNVYADISFHDEIIDSSFRKKYAAKLKEYLATGPAGKVAQRISFGSDWLMLARVPDHERYYEVVHNLLKNDVGLNDGELQNVLGGNALRGLGLTAGGNGHDRLKNYYKAAGIDPPDWFERAGAITD